jgi:hypothetical protein
MGRAGTATIAVPGDSYTEVEFTVRASINLPPGAWFELRLTDAGQAIAGATTASLISESTPHVQLTPGQRDGVPVGRPVDAGPSNPRGIAGVDFPLVTPGVIAASWTNPGGIPIYRLAVALPVAPQAPEPLSAPFTSPHGPDTSLVSDTCSACHAGHTARSGYLTAAPGGQPLALDAPQQALCFVCHNGMGANSDVQAQYELPDPSASPSPGSHPAPVNVPGAREYYRHDPSSDPNIECASCHNPHDATAATAIQTTTGWTVSGAQSTVAGVAVTNGAANTTPTYTIQDGTYGHQPTREYELCLACHAGSALASNAGQPPSRYELDKGVELNPANSSYHPVEAAGTNTTAAMTLSLSGTSPYKQWDFATDGTVRCVSCHADSSNYVAQQPTPQPSPPAAGSDLAPHTSPYRGILIQDYRDRTLKSSGEDYAASDSALCLVCHAEDGFVNSSSSATNFALHQQHLTGIAGKGNGDTNIDTPGAGQGNAICAECHFRIHGTALAYQVGDRSNTRLVNFAPDVQPYGGDLEWTPTGIGAGSCTLTCHGYDHGGTGY